MIHTGSRSLLDNRFGRRGFIGNCGGRAGPPPMTSNTAPNLLERLRAALDGDKQQRARDRVRELASLSSSPSETAILQAVELLDQVEQLEGELADTRNRCRLLWIEANRHPVNSPEWRSPTNPALQRLPMPGESERDHQKRLSRLLDQEEEARRMREPAKAAETEREELEARIEEAEARRRHHAAQHGIDPEARRHDLDVLYRRAVCDEPSERPGWLTAAANRLVMPALALTAEGRDAELSGDDRLVALSVVHDFLIPGDENAILQAGRDDVEEPADWWQPSRRVFSVAADAALAAHRANQELTTGIRNTADPLRVQELVYDLAGRLLPEEKGGTASASDGLAPYLDTVSEDELRVLVANRLGGGARADSRVRCIMFVRKDRRSWIPDVDLADAGWPRTSIGRALQARVGPKRYSRADLLRYAEGKWTRIQQ